MSRRQSPGSVGGRFVLAIYVLFVIVLLGASSASSASSASRRPRRRRSLQQMSAALPLHGAVRDSGYFFSSISLGTPPKKFTVIVDTGSTMTYIPCSGRFSCGSCGPNHQTHAFDPDASHTCDVIDCSSDKCRSNACSPVHDNACVYSRTYVEQSSSSGIVLEDVLHLGRPSDASRVRFGCETNETGEIFEQAVDGLLGLGNSEENIVRQLGLKQFSLCFGLVEGDGLMVLGELEEGDEGGRDGRGRVIMFSPMVDVVSDEGIVQPWYTVMMERVRVGGEDVMVFDSGDGDDGGGVDGEAGGNDEEDDRMTGTDDPDRRRRRQVVLDSGTTFSYFPNAVFEKFAAVVSDHAIGRGLYHVPGPDPDFDDICFGGAGMHDDLDALESVFPSVTLSFEGGAELKLKPLQYLFVHTFDTGKYCLGVFDNGEEEGFLLGAISFRDVFVNYDLENKRVGFSAEASCRELGLKYGGEEDHEVDERAAVVVGDKDENEGEDDGRDEAYEAYEAYEDGDAVGGAQDQQEQPALSYEDDWAFASTPLENFSTNLVWILLGVAMALSIVATFVLAVRKTMHMLATAKYDRVDGSDRESQSQSQGHGQLHGAVVFSPRFTNSARRSSTDSRLLSSFNLKE